VAVADAARGPLETALGQAAATGAVEAVAVLCGIGYILLAIRQQRACWIFGGLSTALYIWVFADARLYLQAALQVLYVLLAVHGWRQWGREGGVGGPVVRRLAPATHWVVLAATAGLTILTAPLLGVWSDSAAPWTDSLGTWSSVAATWLMIRKVAANWLWWIVADTGLAALFASQGLLFTALLYLLFAGLAVSGWRAWRRAPVVA
jgi:nicotinamide mononucleotide transporter